MNCSNCGKKLKGNENFCRICGTPVTKEEQKEEKIELTDNIDVSKIKVSSDNNIANEDTMDVVVNDDNNKELTAMIEITNSKEDTGIISLAKEEKEKGRKSKTDFNLKESDSSNKIKEILEEMKPEVESKNADMKVDEIIDEMKEPTSIIPDELINEYKKIEESKEESENKEDTNTDIEKISEDLVSDEKEENVEVSNNKEQENLVEDTDNNEKEDVVEDTDNKEKEETIEEITALETDKIEEIADTKEESKNTDESIEEDLDKSIISIEEDKTDTIELSKDKTEVFDKPIISVEDEEFYEEKKSASGIIFGVLFFLALICCGFIFFMYLSSNKQMNDYKNKYNKVKDETKTTSKTNDKSNKNTSKTNDVVEYNGFLFNNIEGSKNTIVENKLVFVTDKNTIALYIKNDTKYTTIKYGKDDYKKSLEGNDYEVLSYGTKVTDQVEYVVYELKDKEGNMYLVAYTKLTEDDTIAFILSNKGNTIDYDLLSETNKIVKSTKENKDSIQYNINLFAKEE